MTDCLFCKIVAGEIPSKKVYEDDVAFAFLDIEPFHDGHTLVVPKRHVADLLEDPSALAEITPAITTVARTLVDKLDAAGINMLSNCGEAAGQSVFHLHVHLVPRREDTGGVPGIVQRQASTDLDEVHAKIVG